MPYLLLIPALLIIAGWAYVNIYRWNHIPVDPAGQPIEEEVLDHVDA